MSAYYDLLEKPDIRRTGEQQPLYARFVAKGTIDRKEFIDRVHLFTGISRSVLRVRWQRHGRAARLPGQRLDGRIGRAGLFYALIELPAPCDGER